MWTRLQMHPETDQTQLNLSFYYAAVCFLCNTKQLLCDRGLSFAYSIAHARGCSLGPRPRSAQSWSMCVCVCVCMSMCRLVCQMDAHNPVCSTQSIKSALSLMRTVPGTNACPGVRIHNWEELQEFISKITRAIVGDISSISRSLLRKIKTTLWILLQSPFQSLDSNVTQHWLSMMEID